MKPCHLQCLHPREFILHSSRLPLLPTNPLPRYRHAAPSGPWPWMDLKNIDSSISTGDEEIDSSWPGYPQNKFGNWTPNQVERSEMLIRCSKNQSSTVYMMDVLDNGNFVPSTMGDGDPNEPSTVGPGPESENVFWNSLQREVSLILSFACRLGRKMDCAAT